LFDFSSNSPETKNSLGDDLCGAAPWVAGKRDTPIPGGLFFNDVRHIETPLRNFGAVAHGGMTPVWVLADFRQQTAIHLKATLRLSER
jgi:hypothetical protein